MTSNNETVCWESSHWVFIIIPIRLWPTLNCPGESTSLVSLVPSSVFTAKDNFVSSNLRRGESPFKPLQNEHNSVMKAGEKSTWPKIPMDFSCMLYRQSYQASNRKGRSKTLKMGASVFKLPLTLNGVVWGHKHGKQLTTDSPASNIKDNLL